MRKLLYTAIFFLTMAVMSGVAENVFYGGRLDADGILQESFFFPLSFLFFFLGLLLLLIWGSLRLLKGIRN